MPARHFILTLYLFIIALATMLLPSDTPSAVNWNSEPMAGMTWSG